LDENQGNDQLVIEVEVPDDASDDQITNVVAQLADRLDDVHRAYGGGGLKVADLEATGELVVPVEVGQ
jgi:hypothetical protein